MKKCNGPLCKGKMKPESAFNKNRAQKDGLHSQCRECNSHYWREHRKEHADHKRKWREVNPEREKAMYSRASAKRDNTGRSRAWRRQNPEKHSAQQIAQTARRRGDLIPQSCEVCGSEKVHMHHDDYSKPLDVRWFCARHHARHEGRNGHERIEQILGEDS
jgi:hypothetical protein